MENLKVQLVRPPVAIRALCMTGHLPALLSSVFASMSSLRSARLNGDVGNVARACSACKGLRPSGLIVLLRSIDKIYLIDMITLRQLRYLTSLARHRHSDAGALYFSKRRKQK